MKINISIILSLVFIINVFSQKKYTNKFIQKQKILAENMSQENHKKTQVMVDKVFSFAELGFHEVESSKYLTSILKSNSLIYGSGLALMLGYFYMNSSNREDEWDNLTDEDIDYLGGLCRENLSDQEKYLVLLQTGDEVLNYNDAADFYKKFDVIIENGGNHRFENFENQCQKISEWLNK